jgi:hypothetical protein
MLQNEEAFSARLRVSAAKIISLSFQILAKLCVSVETASCCEDRCWTPLPQGGKCFITFSLQPKHLTHYALSRIS